MGRPGEGAGTQGPVVRLVGGQDCGRLRATRIAEVELDVSCHGEELVTGRFLAAVPSQGIHQAVGQHADLLRKRSTYRVSVLVFDAYEHDEARVSLHQGSRA